MYVVAIETFICRREMCLIGSTFFGFAQNTIHDFQNTVLNSLWHCLRQMPQRKLSKRVENTVGKGEIAQKYNLTLYHTITTFNDLEKGAF